MEQEELNKVINSIKEKIGEDLSGQVADDIAKIVTANSALNETISNKDKEIEKLNTEKQNLIMANGNLLQQVSFLPKKDDKKDENDKNETEKIKLSELFDEKGNFK